jgi:hypothetical protein
MSKDVVADSVGALAWSIFWALCHPFAVRLMAALIDAWPNVPGCE